MIIIGIIFVIYYSFIVLGHHSVSFSKPIFLLGLAFILIHGLELLGVVTYPLFLKIIWYLVLVHFAYTLYNILLMKDSTRIDCDYYLVFGAGLVNGKLSNALQSRLEKALEINRRNNKAIFIVSGYNGEANAMKNYLVSNGIDSSRIIEEMQAKTTYQNFIFSDNLVNFEYKKIGCISNQFHLYRIKCISKLLKINVSLCEAKVKHISNFASYIREYLAIIKFEYKKKTGAF